MNYPNITLRIKNYVPSIELWNSENESRTVIKGKKGIDTLILEFCELVDFPTQGNNIDELMHLARSGDENMLKFASIDFSKQELDFSDLLQETVAAYERYSLPVSKDSLKESNDPTALARELRNNWKEDALASLIEEIYNTMIARTFYLASETSISTIVLADDRQDSRLREKMSKELATVEEVEFLVE